MRSQGVPGKRGVLIPSAPVCALGQLPLVSKGSLWVLPHRRICLFQQYFYAGEFVMAGGAEEDRPCSERGSPRRKPPVFSGGFPRLRCVGEAAADKNTDPDLQGKALRSFNVRGVRDGDSGGFRIFGRYPNWTFRDSGHFCPRKIPLRPLLLFETERIQTATVAQLGQE